MKQHIVTIVVDQSISNKDLYEHICMEKIKKVYKFSGKCDNQQKYKAIIEVALVYNTQGLMGNIQM